MNDLSEASREAASPGFECVVMKFGGTSVEDAAAIRRLCRLVARPSRQRPVVVVSALAKVTDQLMNAGGAAAAGRLDSARETLQALQLRHETVAGDSGRGRRTRLPVREFAEEFSALDNMVSEIASEKALTTCVAGQSFGGGEALSSNWCTPRCGLPAWTPLWLMPESASLPMPRIPGPRPCGKRPTSG